MAMISLEEAKTYLRVDSSDDDALITALIDSAGMLAKDVARLSDADWEAADTPAADDDSAELISLRAYLRVAVFYTVGYLYEHREEADHHALTLTLRSILFSIREGVI